MVSTTPIRSMTHSRAERRLVRPAPLVHNCPVSAPNPENQQRPGHDHGHNPDHGHNHDHDHESRTWVERDAAVVWHGFTQMGAYAGNAPLVIDRAEGRELIDADGRRYLDAISSLWVNTLGHCVPELDAALVAQ